MESKTIVELTFGDLQAIAIEAAIIAIKKYKEEQIEDKIVSQSQAKKILKIGDPKLKQLIFSGCLKADKYGKIHHNSIIKYLKGESE